MDRCSRKWVGFVEKVHVHCGDGYMMEEYCVSKLQKVCMTADDHFLFINFSLCPTCLLQVNMKVVVLLQSVLWFSSCSGTECVCMC